MALQAWLLSSDTQGFIYGLNGLFQVAAYSFVSPKEALVPGTITVTLQSKPEFGATRLIVYFGYLERANIDSDNADIYYCSYFPTRIKTENIPRSDEVVALPTDVQTTNHFLCFHDFISTQRSQHGALNRPFAPNPQSQGEHRRYRPKDDGTN